MYRKNPKLKKIEDIYSPRRDGFSHPEKCDTCDRSSTSVAKEKAKSILRFVKEGNEVNTGNRSLYRRLLEVISGAKPASPARLAAKRAGGLLKLAQQEKTAQYSNTTNNWNIGRVFKRSLLTKNVFKKALALLTIIAVIITAYFQNIPQTQAGTN